MTEIVTAGVANYTAEIFIQDSRVTNGAGLTGLVFNTAGLKCYGNLAGQTPTAITLATLAAANSAWSSGGFKEQDATNKPGWYRFDVPSAYLTGGRTASFHFMGAPNMVPCPLKIAISQVDLQDNVRAGLTALPNAAAQAAGGLFTRGPGAGQINQDVNGRIDANVASWLSTIPTVNTNGVPKVDLVSWLGTAPLALSSQQVQVLVSNIAANAISAAAIATNAIDADALATDAVNEITAAIKALVIETAGPYTLGQAMSIILSVLAGVTSSGGATLKTPDGSATRVAATTDGSNNRTAMTLTPST